MMAGSLRDLVPDDHILTRVDRVIDLSWLRAEVRDCYAVDGAGRPGIDPRRRSGSCWPAFCLASCTTAG